MQAQAIKTARGPEDILLDSSGSPRLIISCGDFSNIGKANRTGAIYYYNIEPDTIGKFNVTGLPAGIQFFPHGIALHPKEQKLYVIVHDRKSRHSSVVIFNIRGNDLQFIQEIQDSKFIKAGANDLTITEDGDIYLTDTGSFNPLSLIPRALFIRPSITYYNHKTGTLRKVHRTWFANGIHAKGDKLYYVDSIWKRIREMKINNDGTLSSVRKIKVARNLDNISYYEGKLYIPSHNSLRKLKKAREGLNIKPPFSVNEVDLATAVSRCIYTSGEEESIGAVSTVLRYGDHLYLSQIFDSFILKIKYPGYVNQK